MAASSRQQVAALAVLALAFLAVAASAARPAPASGGGEVGTATPASSYLQTTTMYSAAAVVEKARETVEMLMARLPAGPSPRGPGH